MRKHTWFKLLGTGAALCGTAEEAPAASRVSGSTGSTLACSEATLCAGTERVANCKEYIGTPGVAELHVDPCELGVLA